MSLDHHHSVCERVLLLAMEEVPAIRNFTSDANRTKRPARAGTWPTISVTRLVVIYSGEEVLLKFNNLFLIFNFG